MKEVFLSDHSLKEVIKKTLEKPTSENFTELAKFYNYRSYYNKAIDAANKAIELDRFNFHAWFELIMASGFKSESDLSRIRKELEKIMDYLELKGEKEDGVFRVLSLINYFLEEDAIALNLIQKAIEINPENSLNYEVYGYVLHATGDIKMALEVFGKAISLNPRSFRVLRMIAKCYFDLGENEKAMAKVEESLRLEQNFIASWHLLGELYLAQGDFVKGTQALSKAISINPEDWSSYFLLAEYFLSEGKYDNAIAEIEKIKMIMREKDEVILAEVNNFIGFALLQKGDIESAIDHFNIAIQNNSDFALPFYNLGEIELERGNFEKALKFYNEALKRDRFHIPSLTQAGFALLNMKKIKQAEKYFLKALEFDEREYWAYLGLAEVARLDKRYKEQLNYVKKALDLNSESSIVWNYAGVAYQCNRQQKAAEEAYLTSLALDHSNRKAANNLAYLYEKMMNRTSSNREKEKYRELAIETWKVRLLACRDEGTSIKGAVNHLKKLGVSTKEIDNLIRFSDIEELKLIQAIRENIANL